jgi:Leucine-rich repeat (LRR) protein
MRARFLGRRFTSMRRKHHCRQCGSLACSRCAPDEKPTHSERPGRRCTDCVTCTSSCSWKGKSLELSLASRNLASIPRFAWQLLSLHSCILSMNRLRALPMDAGVWSCLKRLELQSNLLAKVHPACTMQTRGAFYRRVGSCPPSCSRAWSVSSTWTFRTTRHPLLARILRHESRHAARGSKRGTASRRPAVGVQLEELPPSLGALQRLELLDAADNCLTALPASLASCESLRTLLVARNALCALPVALGRLPLRCLDVECNRILTLPLSLATAQHLETLRCADRTDGPMP